MPVSHWASLPLYREIVGVLFPEADIFLALHLDHCVSAARGNREDLLVAKIESKGATGLDRVVLAIDGEDAPASCRRCAERETVSSASHKSVRGQPLVGILQLLHDRTIFADDRA